MAVISNTMQTPEMNFSAYPLLYNIILPGESYSLLFTLGYPGRCIAKQKIKDATPSGRRGEVEKRETSNNMATSDVMVAAGPGQASKIRRSLG